MIRNAVVALFSLLMLSACSGPLGPIAGGELEGEPIEWPDDWSYTNEIENVLLQTNPLDPYSVTIWIIVSNGVPYIAAGDQNSRWATNIRNNPEVIISIEGRLISAQATPVVSEEEILNASKLYMQKYEMEQEDFDDADGMLFRLSPR